MKKTLIAGAASFALASMPVIGVFALTDPAAVQDTLTVTVTESCNFTREGGAAEITKTMQADELNSSFGSNTFKAACNNGKGYNITAAFEDLTHSTNNGEAIEYKNTDPTKGSGSWTAVTGTPATNLPKTGGYLGQRTSQDPAGGSTYTVSYKVSTHEDQAQGTYSGHAIYTLVQIP